LTDIMAVIGLNQLNELDKNLKKRRKIAKQLTKGLANVDGIKPQKTTPKTKHSYSYYSAVLDLQKLRCTRDDFLKALQAENIDCGVHYPASLSEQPIVKELLKPKRLPCSEELSKRILSLPMHPYLTNSETKKIVEGVEKVINYYHI
jgi:perosamine synthetase